MVYEQLIGISKEEKVGLIRDGLIDAALSLELVLNTSVTFSSQHFGIKSLGGIPQFCTKKGEQTHLIKTIVNGGLKGTCYMLFDSSELNRVCDLCLPKDLMVDHSYEVMHSLKIDFLTEIDNLLASTIISQIDNTWDQRSLIKTPDMYVLSGKEINKHILVDSIGLNSEAQFKTTFYAHEIGVSFEFIFLCKGVQAKSYFSNNIMMQPENSMHLGNATISHCDKIKTANL
ncbi:MAG: hypothetical protein ABJH72_01635 [Reichenbachiella sp.]|uniref:hypothetical protein n=1 Tax=Reichenbachiella sp. TaxID=2184521 RepID=UPI0032667EC8